MRSLATLLGFALFSLTAAAADIPRSDAPADARLYFIAPQDGDIVGREVTVRFGLTGMGVAPAGTMVAKTGHHHLLINTDVPPLDMPIPNDASHLHFGGGQTEVIITLEPGKHTLQLLLGDHSHMPHRPVVLSEKISITVK